jgi:UDP-2,4-diacetamido-2,4,6-trideoxy-beta-L-altropyranose hydrolase
MQNICIRADGSPEIGLGHLTRCIALAQILKKNFKITFFSKSIPDKIAGELSKNGFELIVIEEESSFLKTLTERDIVVIDGYSFDTTYQKRIKVTGSKLVCIDDTYDQEFVADLIINHSPGIKATDYNARTYTRFALGLEYALLRPSFLTRAAIPRKIDKINSVLICFGGSDYENFTERTLNIVLSFSEFKRIVVVTGFAYMFTNSLIQRAQSDQRVTHYHSIDENEMCSLMRKSDLAIVPASSIIIEALSQKMIVISGYYVENQKKAYSTILKTKLIFGIDDFSNFSEKILENKLTDIKNEIAKGKLINADVGSDKLLDVFKSLI